MKQNKKIHWVLLLIALGVFLFGVVLGFQYNFLLQEVNSPIADVKIDNKDEKISSKWKAYSKQGFTLLVPIDWEEGTQEPKSASSSIRSTKNEYDHIIINVINISEIPDETARKSISQGNVLEYGRYICRGLGNTPCKERFSEVKDFPILGGKGVQYRIIYDYGTSIQELRIVLAMKNDKIYQFQLQQDNSMPKLEASSIEIFEEIMKTLKIN